MLGAHANLSAGEPADQRVHRLLLLALALRAVRPSKPNLLTGPSNDDPLTSLVSLTAPCSLQLAALFHAHGITTDSEGRSFTSLLVRAGNASTLRGWLSPAYAAFSMPNDWLAERISWERCKGGVGVAITVESDVERAAMLSAAPDPAAPAVFLCEALRAECWRRSEQPSSWSISWDRLCAMLREAIG